MSVKFRTFMTVHERSFYLCSLAFCSFLSSVFGVFFAAVLGQNYHHLIYLSVCQPVSFQGFFAVIALPYVLSVILIWRYRKRIVYFIIGFRVFMFTTVACSISHLFPNGSWLVIALFQFPDFIILPMLILLAESVVKIRKMLLPTAVVLLFSLFYYFKVSPFLAILFHTNQTIGRYTLHVGFNWRL